MSDPVDALILDLLDSIGPGRPYSEVIEAWKTSCPRLPVWEEANARGYLEQRSEPGRPSMVRLTRKGQDALRKARRTSGAA